MSVNPPNTGDDLNQIRQLIFGRQIEQVEQRFNQLQNEIDSLNKKIAELSSHSEQKLSELGGASQAATTAIQKQFEVTQKKIEKQLGDVREDLLSEINKLSVEKSDKSHLADYLIEIGSRLKNE